MFDFLKTQLNARHVAPQRLSNSWIYENIQFPFEGRMVNITANYDEYLTLVYGADWKTPTKFKKDL